MKIKPCPELFDDITTQNLKEALAVLKEDHKRRKKGHALAIFEHDINEDLREIKRHIKAFKTVLLYYGVKA
jgi:uncharacterized protein YicC (UPF0701 family)